MRNVWTITLRELKSYFVSPIAYVVSALFLVFMGALFTLNISFSQQATMRDTFSTMIFVLVLIAPGLTMKLLSEEQRMGTIELLLTAPIRDWQVVVGKYLGSLILFIVMMVVPTLYYILLLWVFGPPDLGPIATSYLGIILLGGGFLAIGVFASSLTQNQIVAFILSWVILLLLWIANAVSSVGGSGNLVNAISYLAITQHMDDFFSGVLDTTHIVYALSVIVVALFGATQVLQTRRWH